MAAPSLGAEAILPAGGERRTVKVGRRVRMREFPVSVRALFDAKEAREAAVKFGATEGGNQTLARLDEHLAKMEG